MNAKQEAERLIELFKVHTNCPEDAPDANEYAAKACALICVDEIIKSYTANLQDGRIDFISHNPIDFWNEVKEILSK